MHESRGGEEAEDEGHGTSTASLIEIGANRNIKRIRRQESAQMFGLALIVNDS